MQETVHQMLADPLRRHAAAEAIVAAGRPSLTYAALGRQLERDHAFLRRAGFGPRARIGVAMPSGPEGLAVIAAIARSAACAHFEPDLDVDSLAGLMSAMRLDAVIVPEASASNAVRAARAVDLPLIELVAPAGTAAGEHDLRTDARRDPVAADLPGPDDLAFVWHTSGTSGRPKIVPLEQWRICFDVRKRVGRRRIGSDDRCLIASTMSSAATTRAGLLSNLAAGAAVLHGGDITAESILAAIESLAPTYFVAPPALHRRLLELSEKRGSLARHRLRVVYSSFAEQSPEVRAKFEQRLGVPMVVSYGMTEVGGITETPMPPEHTPVGSVGKPVLDLAIAGDDGSFLGAGRHGEVCVRGPEVIAAYESPAQANREAFRDGWFRTGDSGFLDERGFLHLSGRINDVINRGGVKISPSEVELALAGHPAVREAAVFARRHATLGEDVCAAVVFETGRSATEAELRRFARHRLSAAKAPSRIVAAGALPRNAAGKLQRTELSAFGETLLAQSRQPPRGGVEEQLARIFNEVLRVDDIGRADQFFDRGGDSLRAVEAIERIREAFGVSLSMDTFLENPSVAAVARIVSESAGAAGTTPR
jgi:acyl-CoA synthetase (AMP-forming)/AMP-acid ligase II/acyl carrier protein